MASEVAYLRIPSWEKYQHYKDRDPPWIKLHRSLLTDYKFGRLQDASKLHLISIWLLASQMNNLIPADPKWIAKRINATTTINIKCLIDNGFIEVASGVLADCKQVDIVETETESETEKNIGQNEFDRFWFSYPKKVAKKDALRAWKKIKPNEVDIILHDITKRKANGWADPQFIPNPQTYLNGRRWEDEHISTSKSYPQTNEEWHKLGIEKGIKPKSGESWPNFIGRVKTLL